MEVQARIFRRYKREKNGGTSEVATKCAARTFRPCICILCLPLWVWPPLEKVVFHPLRDNHYESSRSTFEYQPWTPQGPPLLSYGVSMVTARPPRSPPEVIFCLRANGPSNCHITGPDSEVKVDPLCCRESAA